MTEAVIALGANLGEPKKALEQALKRISEIAVSYTHLTLPTKA